jgi:hypothetical protein
VEEITARVIDTHTLSAACASNLISTAVFLRKTREIAALYYIENGAERLFDLQLAPVCHRPTRGSGNWFNLRPVAATLIGATRIWNRKCQEKLFEKSKVDTSNVNLMVFKSQRVQKPKMLILIFGHCKVN